MATNQAAVFGAQSAGGVSGGSVAWFAPAGTAGPQAVTYTAEVQTITISGTPTGGTFTPSWSGLTLSPQAYNVSTASLTTAMNTAWAAYLRGGSIAVTGSAGVTYTVTFPAAVGNASPITVTAALTGGSNPTAAVAETTPGAGANPATAAIPAAFKDAGWCDTSLTAKTADTTKDVPAFGASSVLRTFFSQTKETFDLTFLETNHTTLEVFHRLPIGATGVAAVDGYISGVVDGPPVTQQYAAIFDTIDGANHLRAYCPFVQNTTKGDLAIPFGDVTKRPITLTAYPDSNGNAVYWYPVISALAGL